MAGSPPAAPDSFWAAVVMLLGGGGALKLAQMFLVPLVKQWVEDAKVRRQERREERAGVVGVLKDRVADLQGQVKELQNQVAASNAEHERCRADLADACTEIKSLKTDLARLEGEFERFREMVRDQAWIPGPPPRSEPK